MEGLYLTDTDDMVTQENTVRGVVADTKTILHYILYLYIKCISHVIAFAEHLLYVRAYRC